MKSSLSVELVADESLDDRIIAALRGAGYRVHSIREECAGSTDLEVITRANQRDALLVTEDTDFGTWVFAHKIESVGVIFLRYPHGEHERMADVLVDVIGKRSGSLRGHFVTLTPRKSRFRSL